MSVEDERKKGGIKKVGGSGGAIYGIGVLGAAVYYIVHATSFWMGALGVVKAIFWPGFILYKIFELLKM